MSIAKMTDMEDHETLRLILEDFPTYAQVYRDGEIRVLFSLL